MNWKPDRLLRALLAWTALTTLMFWLPFVRSFMDGSSYEWGLFGFSGQGLEGDLWLPALGVALGLSIQWFGWRGARLPFHALLLLWTIPLGAGVTWQSIWGSEDFRLRGDTLKIDISLAPIAALLFGGFAVLAVFWVIRDLRSGRQRVAPAWSRTNRILGLALVSLVPIQFALLRFGSPVSPQDQIGVAITILQWLLFGVALRPWAAFRRAAPSLQAQI